MTTIYLAGSSRELPRVTAWAARLEEAGFEITCKWWEAFEAGATNEALTDEDRERIALYDLGAIDEAEIVWLLASEHRSDSLVELGYAIGRIEHAPEPPSAIFVSGPVAARGVFSALCDEHDRDEDAFEALCAFALPAVGER